MHAQGIISNWLCRHLLLLSTCTKIIRSWNLHVGISGLASGQCHQDFKTRWQKKGQVCFEVLDKDYKHYRSSFIIGHAYWPHLRPNPDIPTQSWWGQDTGINTCTSFSVKLLVAVSYNLHVCTITTLPSTNSTFFHCPMYFYGEAAHQMVAVNQCCTSCAIWTYDVIENSLIVNIR